MPCSFHFVLFLDFCGSFFGIWVESLGYKARSNPALEWNFFLKYETFIGTFQEK